ILVLVVGFSSSKEIWNSLERNFASQSRARIMQHKLELQTMKKGSLTMREYLNKMKTCFDLLAAVGERVSESDQVLHLLSGLGQEYNSIMVAVTSRLEPWTMINLQSLLLSYESRLDFLTTN
ncbi:Unknown protein, partial [Striga hermonthica]